MTQIIELPRKGWRPRDYQMPAWNALVEGKKNVVLCQARRHGKDELMLNWMAVAAMQRPASYLYSLPTYASVRKALWSGVNPRTARTRVLDAFIPEIIDKIDDKGMMLTLKNKSTVQFVGSDNHSSFIGSSIAGMVMSEAALSDQEAYAFAKPILTESGGWFAAISTPRGRNWFKKLYDSHSTNPNSFVQTVRASETDVFTKEQLAAERRDYIQMYGSAMGNAIHSQEFECSFDSATIGGVFTAELAQLRADGRFGPCAYDPRYPVSTSCDLGISDTSCYLFFQDVGTETRLIDVYASNDNGLEHYVQMLADKGYNYSGGTHWAPHDANHRELISGTSRQSQAARLGLKWQVVPAISKTDQIALACQLINRLVVNSTIDLDTGEAKCQYAMDMMDQYHYKFDSVRKINSNAPAHDFSSHFCDALMLYAVAKAGSTGFARPTNTPILQQDRPYPRMSAIMARNNNRPAGLWG